MAHNSTIQIITISIKCNQAHQSLEFSIKWGTDSRFGASENIHLLCVLISWSLGAITDMPCIRSAHVSGAWPDPRKHIVMGLIPQIAFDLFEQGVCR